jgi:hypothetical protein
MDELNKKQRAIIIKCALMSFWLFVVWILVQGFYLPEWLHFFRFPLADIFQPYPLFMILILIVPATLLFIFSIGRDFLQLLKDHIKVNFRFKSITIVGIFLITLGIIPWIYVKEINSYLLTYGLSRYDRVIQSILNYEQKTNHLPNTLKELVPEYLPKVPVAYFNFGNGIIYSIKDDFYTPLDTLTPFEFEMTGGWGLGGRSIKYCPRNDQKCRFFINSNPSLVDRINENWIFLIYPFY